MHSLCGFFPPLLLNKTESYRYQISTICNLSPRKLTKMVKNVSVQTSTTAIVASRTQSITTNMTADVTVL